MKTLISTLLLLSLFLNAYPQTPQASGKTLFQTNCIRCHGYDGTKGRWGAANLHDSRLTDEAMFNIISNGRGFMPTWGKKFSQQQIQNIIAYVKTLRK